MNDKPPKPTKEELAAEQAKADARDLKKALSALKPFAHLPISDEQPDEAHPAFQIKVEFIRAARKLFDTADFGGPETAVGGPDGLLSDVEANTALGTDQTGEPTTRPPLA